MKLFVIFLLLGLTMWNAQAQTDSLQRVIVLGIAQDGGYPHIACQKNCCNLAWKYDSLKKHVVSLALVDPVSNNWWLFEATPDITAQLHLFATVTNNKYNYLPAGIFITHAHIGHYAGLMQLGREALGAKGIPVYCLKNLKHFIEHNGPWEQLVKLNNITLEAIQTDSVLVLNNSISIQSFTVPHRDEYSETAGFKIITPYKKYLFIPDVDKWDKFNKNIINEVKQVDIALLDATFYSAGELPGRNMQEVPHPFMEETIQLFENENEQIKQKVMFIHFNHTNPLLWDAKAILNVKSRGFKIAIQGSVL